MDCVDIAKELDSIFNLGTSTITEVADRRKCTKCSIIKNSWNDLHPHHIIYTDKRVVKYLCPHCHARITKLNTDASLKVARKLTDQERFRVWTEFLLEDIDNETYNLALQWFNSKFGDYVKPKTKHCAKCGTTKAVRWVKNTLICVECLKNGL